VKIGEYFFRIVFCYLIPILVVISILNSEKAYAEEINYKSQSIKSDIKQTNSDIIKGLKFDYH